MINKATILRSLKVLYLRRYVPKKKKAYKTKLIRKIEFFTVTRYHDLQIRQDSTKNAISG